MLKNQRRTVPHMKLKHAGTKTRGRRAKRRAATIAVLVASLFFVLLVAALAAPADLDTSFDGDGIVTTNFGTSVDQARGVVIQLDGKIVAAGLSFSGSGANFGLARYNTDGSLDVSFDTDGKVQTDVGAGAESANAVALQADGKIVAAGSITISAMDTDFALVRYNANGSLDTTFDADGLVTTNFGGSATHDEASAIAIQPDGKIVVAGDAGGPGSTFALARYNPNGSLDTTFDTDGKVTTSFGGAIDIASAIALQPDGKIVVAGSTVTGSTNTDFALARYNVNGSLDTSFDTDGKVTTSFSAGNDEAAAVALQPDGRIIAAGTAPSGSTNFFALARYNANGSLDTTFDTDGLVTTDFGNNGDNANAVALQPDGKIVVAGSTLITGMNNDFAVARYNTDGSLDASFDGDGKVTTAVSTDNDQTRALAIQPDGRIVVAGIARIGAALDFALVRYTGDPKPNEISNFDTDRLTDIALWNPNNHNWYIIDSTTNIPRVVFNWGDGALGDKAVPGDYDGDGHCDIAVFRPSLHNWYIIKSSDNMVTVKHWGESTDIPVPGDYDLDGKTDTAVFRPVEGNWYVLNSRDNTSRVRGWGQNGDVPVPADYDGDGATDFAVYRTAERNWYIITSRDGFARTINWGANGDKLVPADYDGDGRVDVAVYRTTRTWFIRLWTGNVIIKSWGEPQDIPAPADYDGDGRADITTWRPINGGGEWWILQSGSDTVRLVTMPQQGIPIASAYLPQ